MLRAENKCTTDAGFECHCIDSLKTNFHPIYMLRALNEQMHKYKFATEITNIQNTQIHKHTIQNTQVKIVSGCGCFLKC